MQACVFSRLRLHTLLKSSERAEDWLTCEWVPWKVLSEANNHKLRRVVMRRICVLLFLLAVCFVTAVQAQAPAPKPGPEIKKLNVWLGHWTYDGEYKAGPLGPGGKMSGVYDGQMILGGFFFQGRWTEKGPMGESRGFELEAYDPVNKNFAADMYMDDGSRFSGVLTVAGNNFTWAGKCLIAGKQYMGKASMALSADLMTLTLSTQISADGKTWTPFSEIKYVKTKPAAKK